jgi:serine/threonine-protein kinase
MGVVFKAHDPDLDRDVALKMMRSDFLEPSREGLRRFLLEAQAIARLNHPNIVQIHDFGEHEGHPYFAMAYIAGGSLAKRLDRFMADTRAAAALVEKVARGVQHAHDKGILHRDLKPSNVLLDERDEPLVSDFGLAKLRDTDLELTQPGKVLGTLPYMAPEQAAGRSDQVSAATDVWALGVLLYLLVTGQRPFTGQGPEKVSHCIQNTDPPWPHSLRPGLDRNLEIIALQCLEKDPVRRYPSAGALADDLASWLRGEPIRARRQRLLPRVVRALRRRPTLVTATVLSVTFAVVLALVLVLTAGTGSPSEAALKDWQRRLAAGQAVEIVGATGLPKHHALRAGNGGLTLNSPGDNTTILETAGITLIEFLPDPQTDRYQFRAQMKKPVGDRAEFGIYFLHSIRATAACQEHCYCTLSVRFDGQGTPQASLHFRRLCELPDQHSRVPVVKPMRRPPETGGWYELSVQVTPEAIRASCGGKDLGVLRRPDQDRFARDLVAELPGDPLPNGVKVAPPDFARRGALGLYGYHGSACFRQIVVEPLP